MGLSPSKGGPFLRDATGLVREISPLRAMFFNYIAFNGSISVSSFIWSGLYPSAPFLGLSSVNFAQILTALMISFYGLILVGLLSRMPRSGGEYVFTSRIISPFLGWLETWTLVFANLATIGFELLQISVVLQSFFVAMGAVYGSGLWASLAAFFSSPLNQAVVGVVLVVLMGWLGFTNTRRFTLAIVVFGVLGVSGVLLQLLVFPFVSTQSFYANFERFTGVSANDVVDGALKLSGQQLLAPLTFAVLGPALGFAIFNVGGFQFSSYVGGELKGNYKRNGIISMLGSLWLYTFIVWILLVPLIFFKFGYVFLNAWAYLGFNYPSEAPLGGILPFTNVLGLLAYPNLWPLWFYVTVVAVLLMFALNPVYVFMMSRIVFAWSMDRVVPGWFAHVSERTATPVRIYVLLLIGGLIFYLMSFPPINLNLASLIYYGILTSLLTAILPGFNAILLPFRRKELFESGPFSRRVAGIPLLCWFGVAWLAFSLPVYVAVYIQPLVSGFFSSPTWEFASSSGVALVAGIIVVGSAIYIASKYYNRRQGIDTSLIFKEIPPE